MKDRENFYIFPVRILHVASVMCWRNQSTLIAVDFLQKKEVREKKHCVKMTLNLLIDTQKMFVQCHGESKCQYRFAEVLVAVMI